jgi:hypothetical protein
LIHLRTRALTVPHRSSRRVRGGRRGRGWAAAVAHLGSGLRNLSELFLLLNTTHTKLNSVVLFSGI